MANSPSTRPQTALFLGRGWSFPPRFEAGAVRMVEDEEDIAQSLRILFGTHAGERALQPRYGLALGEQVFEPLSTTMRSLLLERIRTAILVHEPRIQLLDLLVDDQRTLYLIDCPIGDFWRGFWLKYRITKDLACLDKVAKYHLSATQRLRFYFQYTGRTTLTGADKERVRHIVRFFEGRE